MAYITTEELHDRILDELKSQVAAQPTVEMSVARLLQKVLAEFHQAVNAANANGATDVQMRPITDLITAFNRSVMDLGAAVKFNT